MDANGTWSATVLAHRPQQCLLLSRCGPGARRWRCAAAAGRPRRRPWRLHSRRHASLVLNCPALARSNSISCYRILKERVEPKCLAGRQLSGNCFWFDPLLLSPTRWTSGLVVGADDLPKRKMKYNLAAIIALLGARIGHIDLKWSQYTNVERHWGYR